MSQPQSADDIAAELAFEPPGPNLRPARLRRGSPAYLRLEAQLGRLRHAPGTSAVVVGPTGCGKRSALAALHRQTSARATAPFLELHCGGFGAEAVWAELFGGDEGPGALERAAGGTLLLREVGALPHAAQAQLAQVLESRAVWRRRGQGVQPLRARVAATSRTALTPQVEAGTLLCELFEQLMVFTVEAPPLSACPEDILPLAHFFLAEASARRRPPLTLTHEAAEVLGAYTYPGNVRELRTIVARAALVADGARLHRADITLARPPSEHSRTAFFAVELGHRAVPLPLEQVSRRYVARVLAHYRERRTAAAEALGISYPTFLKRLRELGLDEEAS